MNLDFASLHGRYLTARQDNGSWTYEPYNAQVPASGGFLASQQIFSNNALQIALFLYNKVQNDKCTAVKHCLFLNFSHKSASGGYGLNNDPYRLTFQIDIGIASALYSVITGLSDDMTYRVARQGKPPKSFTATAAESESGSRAVSITASSVIDGTATRITVMLSRADQIAVAAYCLGYCRLLYPSLGDAMCIALLSEPQPKSRACARFAQGEDGSIPTAEAAAAMPVAPANDLEKLRKAIWAIGVNKWPRSQTKAIQRIQALGDHAQMQALVRAANAGDFSGWDSFL